ncbi:NPCBM/NEW2 domain-containing protein [Deinococcus yavapaiensis]|uniref:Ig-like domain-containing protein n=1 Tax=Deinococcus yavapaiensis KR-236 TaxID=694435 RepID=A0A318SES5_9DEIO|nr:NPCBM/NEW2 domain-containing protein [Deinococcus yavapaiensis]PYE55735.1 Ig-like domain-containing protein [Deinococcus yavapaiensis KR-236]
MSALLALAACSAPPATPTPSSRTLESTGVKTGSNPYAGGKSYPWSDRVTVPKGNPYANGRSYPWVSPRTSPAQGVVRAQQTTGGADTFLSDLPWTAATNAWGPVEKDKSNGEWDINDGRAISIRGQTFAKGLGTHANSSVTYNVSGQCTAFTATLGVDDEVSGRGKVVYQVFGDGVKLYESAALTGTSAPLPITVDVTGKNELKLVVTDGGDGIDYDHADWAAAKVTCTASAPTSTSFLSDLKWTAATNAWGPVEKDLSNGEWQGGDGRAISIRGQTFAKGLGTHANSSVTYNLAAQCTTFTATLGLDDEVSGRGKVVYQVFGDGVKLYESAALTGTSAPLPITVDVTGKNELKLVVTDGGDGIDYDHADWANAKVNCTAGAVSFVKVNFQPSNTTLPAGYIADTGAAFDETRGYGWVREDSLTATQHVPLDLTPNTRDRALPDIEPQLNTLIHMQYPVNGTNTTTIRTPGAWEYKLPNGTYTVTVGVGDPTNAYDSNHVINLEGRPLIMGFAPKDTQKFTTASDLVTVADGRLTIDAIGGTNTKLDYVRIDPGTRPSVAKVSPQDAQTMVAINVGIAADLNLPNSGGIDPATLTGSAVRLYEANTNTAVTASVTTSGGGDVIVLKPRQNLKANTRYFFEVTDALKDLSGANFVPFRTSFVTGSTATGGGNVSFVQIPQANVPAMPYTSVEIGPDNKLYAATLTGEILRFGIGSDGTLTAPQVLDAVPNANGGPRTIIGLKFDPAATADNLVLWISNNAFWDGQSDAPDWSGKITRLSGPDLATVQDVVTGLPRSARDHMTNSLEFKPSDPNTLYVLQGSMSAMGAPDNAWSRRAEHLLNAAILKVDVAKVMASPVNVKTEDGGTYNPYATNAPVTIYATGIRNAFDMVWHTNGQLYVPTNGSAAGGNTPGTPTPLPAACGSRPDGAYTAPAVPALTNVGSTQHDYLFRITPGGYYGHPNPLRCEWVMNGGNPTSKLDPAEVPEYPVGTLPDRNWKGSAYDFGEHASPNGVIEEYTNAPTSALRNRLLVVRYSAQKDIIVLTPGSSGDIVSAQENLPGLVNFTASPLDLTEHRPTGNLYVAQLDETTGSGTITLVRPQ